MPYISKKRLSNNVVVPIGSNLFGTCTTQAIVLNKTATLSAFNVLTEGVTVHIYFKYGNTLASRTLKVGNTDAKPIKAYGSEIPTWEAESVISFTYHNDAWWMNDRQKLDGDTKYSISIEGNKLKLTPSSGVAQTVTLPSGALVGEVKGYAGATAPSGWLVCDGSAVSRDAYSDLFAVIGTTYGSGDGSTTFNLPNMGGKTMIGADTDHALGASVGAESKAYTPSGSVEDHVLTTSEIPRHNHGWKDLQGGFWNLAGQGTSAPSGSASGICSNNTTRRETVGYAVNSMANTYDGIDINASHEHNYVGESQPHNHGFQGAEADINVMQPSLAMNYIIYAGV